MLLVRHEKDGQTYWLLPGGGVEFGEPLDAALRRELKEEARVDIRVGDLVFANDSIDPGGERHIVNLYFTAEVTNGRPVLGSDDRTVELRFVPLGELPKLTFYPDIGEELVEAIQEGFPRTASYLGTRWKENP